MIKEKNHWGIVMKKHILFCIVWDCLFWACFIFGHRFITQMKHSYTSNPDARVLLVAYIAGGILIGLFFAVLVMSHKKISDDRKGILWEFLIVGVPALWISCSGLLISLFFTNSGIVFWAPLQLSLQTDSVVTAAALLGFELLQFIASTFRSRE